jgi:hypothetical protein
LTPFWQNFLFHAFNQCILSTAFVECLFAKFKQWLSKCPKAPSVNFPAAKHMTSGCSLAAKLKLGKKKSVRPSKTRRPEWVFRGGEQGRSNARHMWIADQVRKRAHGTSSKQAFAQAVKMWRGCSPEAKRSLRVKARAKNVLTRQLKSDALRAFVSKEGSEATHWGLSDGSTEYPLAVSAVQSVLDMKAGIESTSRAWTSVGNRVSADPSFPAQACC